MIKHNKLLIKRRINNETYFWMGHLTEKEVVQVLFSLDLRKRG